MLIGLSVSGCILEMVEGTVDAEQVAYIVGGIKPGSFGENLDKIVTRYRETYWRDCPDRAEHLFREMHRCGRVLYPRMNVCPYSTSHWQSNTIAGNLLMIYPGKWLVCEQVDEVEEYFGSPEWM